MSPPGSLSPPPPLSPPTPPPPLFPPVTPGPDGAETVIATLIKFRTTLDLPFEQFDIPVWNQGLATSLNVPPAYILTKAQPGSVVVSSDITIPDNSGVDAAAVTSTAVAISSSTSAAKAALPNYNFISVEPATTTLINVVVPASDDDGSSSSNLAIAIAVPVCVVFVLAVGVLYYFYVKKPNQSSPSSKSTKAPLIPPSGPLLQYGSKSAKSDKKLEVQEAPSMVAQI